MGTMEQITPQMCLYYRAIHTIIQHIIHTMNQLHNHTNLEEALEGLTQQLFKYIATTRYITREQVIATTISSPEVIVESTLHRPRKRFSLSLPGGKMGRKLLDFWLQKYSNNSIWKEVDFYQTNEQYFAPDTTREHNKWEEHPFFSAARVHPTAIHPILSIGSAERSASLYSLKLPHSHCTLHHPTPTNTPDRNHSHHDTPFHCAIVCFNNNGAIDSTFEYTPQSPVSESYYTTLSPGGEKHIVASIPLLLQVPRLLVLLNNTPDSTALKMPRPNTEELFGTEISTKKLIDNHPCVHTFSDTDNPKNVSEINRLTFDILIVS